MSIPPIIPLKRRVRRKRQRVGSAPPPAALTLVSATYQLDDPPYLLLLVFDRAIDIAGFDGTQVIVQDGGINVAQYNATGPVSLINPSTIRTELVETGSLPIGEILLTASAASGIVAVDDGGTWAGVTDLVLPFP